MIRNTLFALAIAAPFVVSATTLKVANNHNQFQPTNVALKEMSQCLAKESDGNLELQVYSDGLLGSEQETIDQMKVGIIDMVRASAISLEAYNPTFSFLNLPYLADDRAQMETIMNELSPELFDIGVKDGFRTLTWSDGGSRSFYNVVRPINKPEDLKGLKIRVPNSQSFIRTVELLGATPTPLPISELYTGLQSGVVDGAEGDISGLIDAKLGEVVDYYSFNHHYIVPDFLVVSNKTYDKLTDRQKDALSVCGKAYTKKVASIKAEAEKTQLDTAKTKMNVKFNEVDNIQDFIKRVKPMYVEARKNKEVSAFLDRIAEIKAQ